MTVDVKIPLKKRSKSSKVNPVLVEKKKIAIELFEGRCRICHRPYGKGFLFHHTEYVDGELTSNDFCNTVWYHAYVLPIILEDPDRFLLFCSKCHFLMFLADLADDRFDRLVECVKMTKPRKHVKNPRN